MTHEDAGHYGAKHPAGTVCDPAIAAALEKVAENERVACAAAHEIAAVSKIAPSEVGKAADLLEYRIIKCQMGLFGHEPEKRTVRPAEDISEDLRDRLGRYATNGQIPCASCWKIAEELGSEKLTVSCACEALGIRVKHCQLGAF
ncbi:MAG: hypothetical protein GX113_02925 [Actinobacteria bacterium]|jgi:hypothetical protein|nr:hypothetical protein [Actinomycetota bacterium]